MFLLWAVLSIVGLVMIYKKKVKRPVMISMWLASFIIGGIILHAMPNPVAPIQQAVVGISAGMVKQVMPYIMILIILVGSGLVVGRVICGYACPLGSMQELLSQFRYKYKFSKKNPKQINAPFKFSQLTRIIFIIVFLVVGFIWGAAIIQKINPFIGFNVFDNTKWGNIALFLIPIIFLAVIAVLSIFIYRPWCRYLCPFGLLAGFTSKFAILKLRKTDACNDCGLCSKVCPTNAIDNPSNGECYYCGRCIAVCAQDALELGSKNIERKKKE